MHSIAAISPGVEDSAHLRTLSSSPRRATAESPAPARLPDIRLYLPLALCRSSELPKKGLGSGRELHPADNTSWTDNEPARLSSYVQANSHLPLSVSLGGAFSAPATSGARVAPACFSNVANPQRELPAEITVTNLR